MSKRFKDAERFSKGSAIRHKEQMRELCSPRPKCPAVYDGPSAAKGGECLLPEGHDCDHETHGIAIGVSGQGIIQDGSEHFHWHQ